MGVNRPRASLASPSVVAALDQVSQMVKELDAHMEEFRTRPLRSSQP
jgi:hypothetical protein